jgi:hypothetical protein
MPTITAIGLGLVLLAVCLLIGSRFGRPNQAAGLAKASRAFVPLWLLAAAINMWLGVQRTGQSIADQLQTFALVFAVPTVVALLVWWRFSRA